MDFFLRSSDRFHSTISKAELAACALFVDGVSDQFLANPCRASPVRDMLYILVPEIPESGEDWVR